MKPVRVVVLGVAAVAAIGLAVVVRGVFSSEPSARAASANNVRLTPAKPMAKVLVAKRDLKVGERLAAADMGWQDWPLDAVNPHFVTDGSVELPRPAPVTPAEKAQKAGEEAGEAAAEVIENLSGSNATEAFMNAVVREPLLAGEPLTDRKLVRAGESGVMAVVLQPGMRAMAIPVSVETAAGGFILPGDRVDVLLSRQVEMTVNGAARQEHVSETVLRNVKVLAVDQTTATDGKTTTVVGATATLELAAADSEVLALAKAQGDLTLTLRSYADVSGPTGRPLTAARPERVADNTFQTVRVFRDGQVQDVTVNQ